MNLKNIGDSLRHAFVEEDDPAPASVQQAAVGQDYAIAPTVSPVIDTPAESVSGENPFIAILKRKCDFGKTPVGIQVLEHLAPLEGMGLTDAQKFTIVLKSGAKEGLTADAIVKSVNECSTLLQNEEASFKASSGSALAKEVDGRKKLIQDETGKQDSLRQQIAASQEVQNNISAEMIEAQSRIARTQAQFQVAFTACRNELGSTLSHYTTILKGSN